MLPMSVVSVRLEIAGLPADFRDIIGKRVLLTAPPPKLTEDFIGVVRTYIAVCTVGGMKVHRDGSIRLLFQEEPEMLGLPSSALMVGVGQAGKPWHIVVTDCEYCQAHSDDGECGHHEHFDVMISLFG